MEKLSFDHMVTILKKGASLHVNSHKLDNARAKWIASAALEGGAHVTIVGASKFTYNTLLQIAENGKGHVTLLD